ncbi:DUF6968 family protein [Luteibacter sp. UNCMF366Tsu5.1]|uniref:DUF6968 family protein n=1 Tax=Luteibacter sp. UNCMF366Tsu5.1 TaxID=1502758 RepID=UPI000908BBA7|nr:hypothetical protein [Luteibacter sp. UNCMF366Tsu5.1]SFW69631.1 hypothetical protein SAMN02800691_3032 [Luteibacter sp. UNCMF366Tsu5.1]
MTNTFNKTSIAFEFDHKYGKSACLLIGTPIRLCEDEWQCPYQFVGLSNTKTRWISGADAYQSLVLAIRVAAAVFSQLEEVQDGTVTWLGSSNLALFKTSEP